MQAHIELPNIGGSIRHGGEAFVHLLKDSIIVNSNLYGDRGGFPLSLQTLMLGCEFYSSQRDSSKDIFALMLLSSLAGLPYLGYRLIKDSGISLVKQMAHGINDTYLADDSPFDSNDPRHGIAKVVGLPGLVVGGLVRTAMYGGGLFGLSSFGFNRATKAFKTCTNFIFDANHSTEPQDQALSQPRNLPATVLKHVNLVRVSNGLGYTITAACGVLGLTVHSMRAMRRGLNVVNQAVFEKDIFHFNEAENQAYGEVKSGSKEWFARAGLLGLGGLALGTVGIGFTKSVNLVGRALGFSSYGGHLFLRACYSSNRFIWGDDLTVEENVTNEALKAHKEKENVTWSDRADRLAVLVRVANGLGYAVSFACGVLGLTHHSMVFMSDTLSKIHDVAFGTAPNLLGLSGVQQAMYDRDLLHSSLQAKKGSKEWFARAGLLGLGGLAFGTVIIAASKTVHVLARVLGISDYSANLITRALKHCTNFVFGAKFETTQEDAALNAKANTVDDYADRLALFPRLLNAFAYTTSFAFGVLGLTSHSMGFMWDVLGKIKHAAFDPLDVEVQEAVVPPQVLDPKEKAARFGLFGLAGIALGATTIGFVKTANLIGRALGISGYSANLISRALKNCVNFVFASNVQTTQEVEALNTEAKTLANYADRIALFPRLFKAFAYTTSLTFGILGLTSHSMGFMWDVISKLEEAAFGPSKVEEQQSRDAGFLGLKEKAARFGLFGLAGIALGATTIGFVKTVNLLGRALGISDYSADLITRALKRCANFVFGANFDTSPEQVALNVKAKTLANYADRLALFPRILNAFAYTSSLACGVLGLTSHSMGFMWDVVSKLHEAAFGPSEVKEQAQQAQDAKVLGLKEKAARFGLFGLAGIALGAITIGFVKTVNLVGRSLGISDYSADLITRVLKHCANFVFGANFDTSPEQNALNVKAKTLGNYADRLALFPRILNAFAYTTSFACGVLGLTSHSMGFMWDVVSKLHEAAFGPSEVKEQAQQAQDAKVLGLKEKAARFGLFGLAGIALGAITIGFVKTVNLVGRSLGISDYSADLITRILKHCANFVFGANFDTSPEQNALNVKAKTLANYADRLALFPRILNAFAYTTSFACGVLGLTSHSIGFMWDVVSKLHVAAFGSSDIKEQAQPTQAARVLGLKEKAARFGLFGLAGIALGATTIGFVKTANLLFRALGVSDYSGNLIASALKDCASFVFGANFDTTQEQNALNIKARTLANYADRLAIFPRILNAFAYTTSFACGVLGLTSHSIGFMWDVLGKINQAAFGSSEVEEQEVPKARVLSLKEKAARFGILGLAGIALGTIAIGFVKSVNLIVRALGISSYSGNLLTSALKNCSNFVFGTHFETKQEVEALNAKAKTLADYADRLGLFVRLVNSFSYAVSAVLGIIGLTAANYHRTARVAKNFNNMFADEGNEKSVAPHTAFLNKMAEQNLFTNVTSRFNPIRIVAAAIKYGLWFASASISFAIRRVWKLTLGNVVGNACGSDGTFLGCSSEPMLSSSEKSKDPAEKMNRRFRDLLWCLTADGDLREGTTYNEAIANSKDMSILDKMSWRIQYEFRKSASIFSLDTPVEKVILHFASTFQQYVREEQRKGTFNSDKMAFTFFGARYDGMVKNIKGHYKGQEVKAKVDSIAHAIKDDIMKEMGEMQEPPPGGPSVY